MKATDFYEAFLDGWSAVPPHVELRRLAGKTLKWKIDSSADALTFAVATNAKTAGLLPNLPGEFRLSVDWRRTVDGAKKSDSVSWFQYTTELENNEFAQLQRSVLHKFLAQPGKAPLGQIYNYTNDPTWLPRANYDEFAYYFDADDARSWGRWYSRHISSWIERFTEAPESFNDWCSRVLWPKWDSRPG